LTEEYVIKPIAGTLALTMTLVASASAVQQRVNPQQAEQIRQLLQEVKDRLQVTPEQLEKVRPIVATELERMKASRDKHDLQTRRGKIGLGRDLKQIQGETEKQLKPILSKPQMDELAKIRAEFRERIRASRG
jgi:hypothetical protein